MGKPTEYQQAKQYHAAVKAFLFMQETSPEVVAKALREAWSPEQVALLVQELSRN
jgi:hypothetical protein